MKTLPLKTWLNLQVRDEHYWGYTHDTGQGILIRAEAIKPGLDYPTQSQCHRLMYGPSHSLISEKIYDVQVLTAQQKKQAKLGPYPHWAKGSPTESAGTWWHDDARITPHPAHPKQCEALFYFAQMRTIELLWVEHQSDDTEYSAYHCKLMNNPSQPTPQLELGTSWSVRGVPGSPIPFFLTSIAKANLKMWEGCCDQCGFDIMFTPWKTHCPTTHLDAHDTPPQMLTVPCLMCHGTMLMIHKS